MALDEDQKKCGGITFGGLLTLVLAVAMIVLGCINLDFQSDTPVEDGQCQAEVRLPVWLIAGGILFVVMLFGRLVFQRMCRKCGEFGEDSKFCSSLNFACKFSCILMYDIVIMIVYLAWLIVGTIWTMNVYDEVNFDGGAYYCPEYFYLFTFWVIIALWVVFVLSITCGLLAKFCSCFYDIICCKPCKSAEGHQTV